MVVVVEKDLEPELKGLHPSVLVLNCFEFAMWITMIAFAKESSFARYDLEEAVVKLFPEYSHDSNFVHREFEWLCETKDYIVQCWSSSEKVVDALEVFRLVIFDSLRNACLVVFVSVILISFSGLMS